MSVATLARRLDVPRDTLEAVIAGNAELEDNDIILLAKELGVPVQALFAKEALPLMETVDYRSETPRQGRFHKGTLQAISFVEKISSALTSLQINTVLDKSVKRISVNYTDAEAIKLAKIWRANWGMTNEKQLEIRNSNQLYVSLRGYIEKLGVLVLHRSFESDEAAGIYAHIDSGPHAIIINTTKSSKARKLFTLAHEFCHVLLRAEGASNPSVLKNRIEKFCNKFAAYLLAPDSIIHEGLSLFKYKPSNDADFIRLFAANLGISQEAVVRRLVEVNLLNASDYAAWRSRFNGVTPPADMDGGGFAKVDPLQTKRTIYGTRLLKILADAREQGVLDEIDIYRLVGLKPKYQDQLFGAA